MTDKLHFRINDDAPQLIIDNVAALAADVIGLVEAVNRVVAHLTVTSPVTEPGKDHGEEANIEV